MLRWLSIATAVLALAGGASAGPKPVTVTATLHEWKVQLSRTHVPVGGVTLVVVNKGSAPHDLFIAGKKTRVLARGEQQTLKLAFTKAATYALRCKLAGHAELGMKGSLTVGSPPVKKAALAGAAAGATGGGGLALTRVGTFARPVHVAAPPGDPRRVFVVEQAGAVRVLLDGALLPEPFLDLSAVVRAENETGLLSLAFAPDYAESRRFYVLLNTHAGNGDLELREYRRSTDPDRADPGSARVVLTVVKPWENHNGGMLQFGPDGLLYASVGDGDSGVLHAPGAFAQTLGDLLGSILRIDPRPGAALVPSSNPFAAVAGARGEVWAYGLRNPWRFWIDPATSLLYIADVALDGPEEVDVVASGAPGGFNFGWPCFQGTHPFDEEAACPGATAPALEYGHAGGACSVTGGVVSRDPRLPALAGRYLYADLCTGVLRSFLYADGRANDDAALGPVVKLATSFGVDALARIYVTSLDGGVYRLDPA